MSPAPTRYTDNDRNRLAAIITGGLSNGVTTEDFKKARTGALSVGQYIAGAILTAGWANVEDLATKAEAENRADPAYPYAPTVAGGAARWLRAEAARHKA